MMEELSVQDKFSIHSLKFSNVKEYKIYSHIQYSYRRMYSLFDNVSLGSGIDYTLIQASLTNEYGCYDDASFLDIPVRWLSSLTLPTPPIYLPEGSAHSPPHFRWCKR